MSKNCLKQVEKSIWIDREIQVFSRSLKLCLVIWSRFSSCLFPFKLFYSFSSCLSIFKLCIYFQVVYLLSSFLFIFNLFYLFSSCLFIFKFSIHFQVVHFYKVLTSYYKILRVKIKTWWNRLEKKSKSILLYFICFFKLDKPSSPSPSSK